MKDFIKLMKALSDPNRVKMLKLLQRRVLCVCEIQRLSRWLSPPPASTSRSWKKQA
jgi:DNA-binding transcriptional ArsR family regulator